MGSDDRILLEWRVLILMHWGSAEVFLGEVGDGDVVVAHMADSITVCLVIVGSFAIGDSVIVIVVVVTIGLELSLLSRLSSLLLNTRAASSQVFIGLVTVSDVKYIFEVRDVSAAEVVVSIGIAMFTVSDLGFRIPDRNVSAVTVCVTDSNC